MTYFPETSAGHEANKIASIAVPYLQGRVLDLGCGNAPVWPSVIGIDNHTTFANSAGIRGDIADLSLIADASVDACFSSHALEDFEPSRVPAILKEWWRVIRIHGFLVLYLPHQDHYPHIGDPNCNPGHKWEPRPEIIIDYMKEIGSWTLLENEVRIGSNEYSFFQVYQRDE
jgi:predicted SAM-dependent methyltransferase